jgi:hypothetical protein
MAWTPQLTNLRSVLADLFPDDTFIKPLVRDAGLNPAFIPYNPVPFNYWQNILVDADRRGKVKALVDAALVIYPDDTWLKNAAQNDLYGISGVDIAKNVDWQEPQDPAQLEKIMGAKSTLLDILFLEKGTLTSRSVARIVTPAGNGSGFLVQGGLLVTNNHVLPSADVARISKAEFNYQKTIGGLDATVDRYELDPDAGFATSKENDWSAVRLKGDPAVTWGALELKPATVAKNDTVNIIQHPGGGPKQIALYHNVVTFADDKIVQYLTDTLPGSSGSPCFNDNWELVALHHSGGWLREPGTKDALFRNEGIHINAVIDGIKAAGLL